MTTQQHGNWLLPLGGTTSAPHQQHSAHTHTHTRSPQISSLHLVCFCLSLPALASRRHELPGPGVVRCCVVDEPGKVPTAKLASDALSSQGFFVCVLVAMHPQEPWWPRGRKRVYSLVISPGVVMLSGRPPALTPLRLKTTFESSAASRAIWSIALRRGLPLEGQIIIIESCDRC
jgi:hypothetical protein